jgi:polyhydroxybutyrate depolymerase
MKTIRLFLAIFAFTSLLGAAACGQAAAKPTATPAPTATPGPTIQPGDSTRTLKVGDLERNYLLHLPPGLDNLRLVPLVFSFNGGRFSPDIDTGFNQVSDKNGFLVAYPDRGRLGWNVGTCGGWNPSASGGNCCTTIESPPDDIAFVRQILADLGTIVRIDPKRIYSIGGGEGAMFSYRLACEMSDTFAAIAPVDGLLWDTPCQPQEPVAVLAENGLNDPFLPYSGGVVGECDSPPVEQSIATWVKLDGCTGSAQVEKQGTVTYTVYTACRAGSAVEQYTIEGQGYSWPSVYVLPIDQIIWKFFKAHPKQ